MRRLLASGGAGYLVAVATTAAVFALRLVLDPWLGGASPLLLFILAVLSAAVVGGLAPGLLATILSAAAGSYFLGRDGVPGWTGEATQAVTFLAVGAVISLLCDRLLTTRRRVDAERQRLEREVAERRRAEVELQAQKDLLRTTLTSAGDGLVATDASGRVTLLNPVAEALTGWSQAEAEGIPLTTVFRIVNEETRAEVENPALRALADGRVVGLANHTLLIAKDGTERPIDDSAAPIRDADGRVHGSILVFRDITDRKRAERELRESDDRLRLAVDIAAMGTFDIDLKTDAVLVNDRGRDIYGWRADEPLTFAKVQSHFHPSDKEEVLRRASEALDPGGPAGFHVEQRIVRTDGEERWIRVRGRVLFEGDESGRRAVRCLGTCLDVTEQKAADEALRRSEERYRLVGEAANDAIWDWDLRSGRVTWSPGVRTLFGYADSEVRPDGDWWLGQVHADDRDRVARDIHAVIDGATGDDRWSAEYRFRRADDSYAVVFDRGRVLRDETGRAVRMVGSMLDLTERRRAEAALLASEERFEFVRRTSGVGFWYCDLPFDELQWDEQVKAHFHLPSDATVTIETFYDRIHPDDREATRNAIGRSIENRDPYDIDYRTVDPATGAARWVRAIGRTFYDADGRPIRFDGVTVDATERKQAEQALRESESRFRQLAEAVPQIVWVTRPDGWHEFFNGRWYEYTGLTEAESLGHGWAVPLHPDDKARSEERWRLATDSGKPYEIEYRFRRADGVYRWFLGRALPVRNDSGEVVRWFGTCTDIDDAKRAEQKAAFLADASAHLSELLDYRSTMQKVAHAAVPAFADWIAVDLVGEDGSLQRVATTHADRAKERLARELDDRYPPHPDDAHGPARVLRTGQPELVPDVDESLPATLARDADHLRLLRSLGFRSYLSVPLITKGRATGVLTFVTADSGRRYDASDLRVAEDLGRRVAVAVENVGLYEALREADQRKDEFLATLAHELRNPLAPIRMGLEVLRLGGDDPETVSEMLGTMDRQVAQMVRLIDDLLDVSRITRGKLELRKTRVELKDVVRTAVESVRPMMEESRHELNLSIPDEPLILDGDPARLSQVLSNLLNNAAKYTPEGGEVSLSAGRHGNEAVLAVRDTGVGIPENMLDKVFDMFTQVDRTLERSHGGLGIGLHLVKRLVEMHGGTVTAKSGGDGRGSEFVVRLSLADAARREAPDPVRAGHAVPARRVLIADDNRDGADLLARVLKALGHYVVTAYDGRQAVEVAATFQPDVCLLDIGMPKLNGFDAAREIRRQPWGERIFLVALTGWGAEEDRRRSREAGFDRHLVKPVESAELRDLFAELRRTAP